MLVDCIVVSLRKPTVILLGMPIQIQAYFVFFRLSA